MESKEVSAKSEEEAVDIALAELGLSRSEVEVVVVKRGKSGLFGLGSEEVRIRVTPLDLLPKDEMDIGSISQEVLRDILSQMGVFATVSRETKGTGEQFETCLNILGDDLGILIGRRGETLSSLQYIVNLVVSRRLKSRVGVVVDVEGYRQRRNDSLRALAQRLADQVKSTGRTVTLEPMPASERRIVHLELRDNPHVVTQSMGQGVSRKIAILTRTNGQG